MGSISSKPARPNHSYDRDSVVLCDGLARIRDAMYAGTPDGRYIFAIGNMHVRAEHLGNDNQEMAVSFQIDVTDLFLSKRFRIDNVGDLYNCGYPTGFYALNERTVVLVDYDPLDQALRQRLIRINLVNETAECLFYRGYSITLDTFFHAKTSIGDECAVTVIPSMIGSPQSGIVFPLNPLSSTPHKDITTLIDGANTHVRQFYEEGEAGEARVSTFHPPFFISNTALGFFVDPNNVDDLIDPTKVLVMDLNAGTFYLESAKSSVSFPLSEGKSRPAYAKWSQATNREVALISRFRRTTGWQVSVASLLLHLFGYVVRAAIFMWTWNFRRMGGWCLGASMHMIRLRSYLLEPRTDKFTGFGTLNTRTLEWSEIKATVWNEDETRIIPLREGHFVVASVTDEVGYSRVIGVEDLVQKKMERFRLIRNPLKISSLSRLSSIAVQKIDRVPTAILEQIAARML